MKISVRMKITLMVVIFASFIVAASWIVCNVAIEKIFVNKLKSNMVTTYNSCNKLFNNNTDDLIELGDLYGRIKNPAGSIVLIIDVENNKIYYTSINDDGKMIQSLY